MAVLAPARGSAVSLQTTARIREILEGRRRGLRAVLPLAGPAVVASVAYMDPGNFATNIQAGAKFGYGLLWVVVLANAIAMLFQAMSAKIGIVTGRNLAEFCRDHFPAVGRDCDVAKPARWPRWRPIWRNSSAVRSGYRCSCTCRCSMACSSRRC